MRIEILIILALAVGATFFVLVVAVGLLINKLLESRQTRRRQRLTALYSEIFADLLLQPLPDQTPTERFRRYDELIEPVKGGLAWSTPARKHLHRDTIRGVLLDFAGDLVGESIDRLHYFFEALGFVDDELNLMTSRKWWMRAKAARDLGILRARKATRVLTSALTDEHPEVQNEAMKSLVKLAGVGALRTILKMTNRMSLWTTLELSIIVREFEEEAFPYLIEALGYQNQSVVLFCLEMLAEIGFTAAVEPVMTMAAAYPNVVVRAKAAEALGRLGDQRAEPLLNDLLTNAYPALRSSATKALERIGSPASVPLLKERMTTGPIEDRISAARAMARSGESGLHELREAAGAGEETLRGIALHVLEEVEAL
ncbi:MAG TPA: HEAT repeat domain-containing protein [Bacteroidota bacterium]